MSKSSDSGQITSVELVVEVSPRSVAGDLSPRVTIPEGFQARARELGASMTQVVRDLRSELAKAFDSHHDGFGVDSVEIEFGLSLQAETGVIIAKAAAGATFTVRVTIVQSSPS